jgi:hypothetical protein
MTSSADVAGSAGLTRPRDVTLRADLTGAGVFAGGGQRARVPTGARVPDFFIVGHAKSGTTALYEMLRRHPQIFMPDLKEPRFLAEDLRALVSHSPNGKQPQTLEAYLALFADARPDQRAGEASPSYLRSRTAAGAIAELQPQARIIAILREPASFLRSLHMQLRQDGVETHAQLRDALAAEPIVRDGRRIYRYTDYLHYVEQLRRYEALFGREQMLVLIYDDFRTDNQATVRRVLRFLDVDDTVAIGPVDANPTVRMRSMWLDRVVRDLYAGRGGAAKAVRALRGVVPERARKAVLPAVRRRVVYGKPQPADERLMRELRDRFKDEVVALGQYTDRDLVTEWGYGPRS